MAEVFDEHKLKLVIEDITREFKANHKNLELTVLKQPYELSGEKIVFFLNGEIQQDIFGKIKPELIGYLRRKLNNYSISLDYEIKEETVNPEKRLYTSTDKLNYLLKKSSALGELQKRFGLETDF